MSSSSQRLWPFDFLRGLAVLGMIMFHFFYVLDFYDVLENQMYHGGWLILARFVQITFLLLVGIFMTFSFQKPNSKNFSKAEFDRRQWKRAAFIFIPGLGITTTTFFFLPQAYVRFGILHCIGLSIFLLSFVVGKKYVALGVGIAAFLIGYWRNIFAVPLAFLYPFGLYSKTIFTIDYFPIFPWMSAIAFGIFCGHVLNSNKMFEFEFFRIPPAGLVPVLRLGQHALLVYLVHIPIIVGGLWIFGIL